MSHSTYVAPPPTPAEILSRLSGKISQGIGMAKAGKTNGSRTITGSHHSTRSYSTDRGFSGAGNVEGPSSESFVGTGKAFEIMDFSYILKQVVNYPSEAQIKLESLLARIDERPVYTRKKREELNRLVNQINEYINDPNIDTDDVIRMIEDRVNIYLENEDMSNELSVEELRQEYMVLVSMLGQENTLPSAEEISDEELEMTVERLKEQAMAVEQRVYTAEIMQEVMESLGLTVEEFAVLDGVMEGEVYGFENDPVMKIFVSYQNGSFVFEPIVDDQAMDMAIADKDDKAGAVAEELEKPCALHQKIMEEAAKRGLPVSLANEEAPTPKTVATTSDLSNREKVQSAYARHEQRSEEARKKRYVDTSKKVRAVE